MKNQIVTLIHDDTYVYECLTDPLYEPTNKFFIIFLRNVITNKISSHAMSELDKIVLSKKDYDQFIPITKDKI